MASSKVPIAVVGIGCRLPGGVNNPEDFWSLLSTGRSGLDEVPTDRWNADAFYHPDPKAREALNATKGYFLKHDVSKFDARFFGFTADEASQTDPQQRLMLEVAYEAFENAGVPLERLKGSDTAVFVSVFARDYDRMTYKDLPQIRSHAITGNGEAILAARISYTFDLKGGAMTIDTGCSGSMVAIHQACLSLVTGESRMALAGGTQLLLHPDQFIPWSYNGMANPEGQSFAFDSRGSGYGRGEGVSAVILKKLDHALEDGDTVHAIIRGSGVNHDGKTNGILLPNSLSQKALVESVYHKAGLDPSETLYFEAHGTGTAAGDNAEIESIASAMKPLTRGQSLYVGSVKANIGHLEAASGIAGFIKAILVLQNNQIPPQINFVTEKPGLRLAERGIQIPTELTCLTPETYAGPRRVSVNSYGYGGTNVHVVLEDSLSATFVPINHGASEDDLIPNGNFSSGSNGVNGKSEQSDDAKGPDNGPPLIFPLTAQTGEALLSVRDAVLKWLDSKTRTRDNLEALSYTLSCRRSIFSWRNAAVASTPQQLSDFLSIDATKSRAALTTNVTFVFTGQGAQWHAMGRELLVTSPVFLATMTIIENYLAKLGCAWSLFEELNKDSNSSKVGKAHIAQPATTAIQIALVDLYASVGVRPKWVIGHSSGEIAAAYAAGRLDREAAMQAAYFRGNYSGLARDRNPVPGAMVAIATSEKFVKPLLKIASANSGGQLRVACVNSPESVTVSGDEAAIDALIKQTSNTGVFARKLRVDTAYHSHHMEAIADDYLQSLQDLPEVQKGIFGIKLYSSVTGSLKESCFDGQYWTQNLISQVRFSEAMTALCEDMIQASAVNPQSNANVFIEVGPHGALEGPLRQCLARFEGFRYTYCPSLVRGKNATATMVTVAARLFEVGYNLDMGSIHALSGISIGHKNRKVVHDLAPYPWDHHKPYWRESRLSRDHRFRKFRYHDLLGLLDSTSTSIEPRWRYHISLESLPWLSHHVVEGQVIWPGTGYMCMALEALRQYTELQTPGAEISRIIFRDAEVRKAVIIPSDDGESQKNGVEVQLTLLPSHAGSSWHAVRIQSLLPEGKWILNYTTSIRADLAVPSKNSDWAELSISKSQQQSEALARLLEIQANAHSEIESESIYKDLLEAGNEFGPTFKALQSIKTGKRCGFAEIIIPDIASWMPKSHQEPHLIHPAILDAPNHLFGSLFFQECCKAAVMPTTTEEFQFWPGTAFTPGNRLIVACEITPDGARAAKGSTWLFQPADTDNNEPRLICATSDIKLQAVGEGVAPGTSEDFGRKMVSRVAWGDHIDFLSKETYNKIMSRAFTMPDDRLSIHDQLLLTDQAAAILLERTNVADAPPSGSEPHLKLFHDWITSFLDSDLHKSLLKDVQSPFEKDKLLELASRESGGGVTGQMLARVGKSLPEILSGKTHALSIMLEDDLLNRFYMDGPLQASNAQAAKFVSMLAHNQPDMSILEIGAGTGSTTLAVLEALSPHGELLADNFTYTDLSAGFFEKAAEKFSQWSHAMSFRVLDASKDPTQQGFQKGAYDLIIASNIIHATPSISDTLANVRKLLRVGGRLVLLELTRPTIAAGMIFGTLSGWWSSEDGRTGSPILSREAWDEALRDTSFSGLENACYDDEGPFGRTSVMISKAVIPNHSVSLPQDLSLSVIGCDGPEKSALLRCVISLLKKHNVPFQYFKLDTLGTTAGDVCSKTCLVLDDAEKAILASPTSSAFRAVQSIMSTESKILWIGYHQGSSSDHLAGYKALSTGAARTLRREYEGLRFVTLDVQDSLEQPGKVDETSNWIYALLSRTILDECTSDPVRDNEFSLRDGRIEVPRLHTDKEFFSWVDNMADTQTTISEPFFQPKKPLKLVVSTPGLLSSLRFAPDPTALVPLASDELQVRAHAYGVNFRDVFIALGQLPPTSPMAGEVAGVVTAIGSDETSAGNFKVGDRVIGLLGAPYASESRLKALHCQRLPDSVSFKEGASIYTVFQTVYYSLVEVARLQPGQSIMIHSASGGVGQAAIQIAKYLGASNILAIVGSEAKKKHVHDEYGIDDAFILSSRWSPQDIQKRVMQLTGSRGVDVVVNSMAGDMLNESWNCLAPLGTHIELGKADIYKKGHLPMAPFDQNRTFAAVDLTVLLRHAPLKMFNLLKELLVLFDKGVLRPVVPLTVLPIHDIEAAFRNIAERRHMGKIVLECDETMLVNTLKEPPKHLRLHSDGTYVISGGLGDIGQRLVHLLAEFGAGHIVTLSRRDLNEAQHRRMQAEIATKGCQLHVIKCDVTDSQSVASVKAFCDTLPPVRGVIQGAMVLRDRPLGNMNSDDWNEVLRPRVDGTLHLDKHFSSSNLDFFICLSSLSGIVGRMAQSNYSAANCFLDAYMLQRNKNCKTSYFTVNVGAVVGSESITSMKAEAARQELLSQASITFSELFKVLQYAMDPRTSFDGRVQAVMGIDRKSLLSNDHVAAANPYFSMLPHLDAADTDEVGGQKSKRDPKKALIAATSLDEAAGVIAHALADKLTTFTSRDLEDINLGAPLVSFGLDSLVSIELKNWMMRIFSVTLQVSELVGPASINDLSKTLVGRSTLVQKEVLESNPDNDQHAEEPESKKSLILGSGHSARLETSSFPQATKPDHEHQSDGKKSEHNLFCCRQFEKLPKQPIPDIDEVLESHVQSVAHFAANEQELEDYRTSIKELRAQGSTGRRIHDKILQSAQDPNVENWISDHLLKAIHLDWRHGVPFASFLMLQHDSPVSHTQAERASIIAISALQFKDKMNSDALQADWQFAGAQCKHLQPWLFNATREPGLGSDVGRRYSADHFVILRRGHLFKIPYKRGDTYATQVEVKYVIEDILEAVQDEESWAGILTTDNRDSWARKRQQLLEVTALNAEYLATIDEATIVINLDESTPKSLTERLNADMFNSGSNRWWDKPLQFIVNANGRSAVILEHSHIDGVTALPLLNHLHDAIQSYKPFSNGFHRSVTLKYQELKLVTTPEVEAYMAELRENWKEMLSHREIISRKITELGSKFLSAHGMPIKGVIELLIKLANRRYNNGVITEAWQGVSHAHFHLGRHDMVQTVTGPVAEFCTASTNPSIHIAERKSMMVRAAADISSVVKDAINGNGFYRLVNLIKAQWPEDEARARFFEHPIYRTIDRYSLVITMLDPITPGAAAMPANPHALRVRYSVEEESVTFGVIGPTGKVREWEECLDWATGVIRDLILQSEI